MASERVLRLLGILLLAACAAPEPVDIVPEEPPPWQAPDATGPYMVGVTTHVLQREEGLPLNLEVWYPAVPDEDSEITIYDELFRLRLDAWRDADPDTRGTYPVVLFSHGFGGIRFQSAFLTEHLASHGYVVIAPDHPRNTLLDLDFDAAAEVATWRPRDLADALTWLLDHGGDQIGVNLDETRVGAVGHSFGSMTVLVAGGAVFDPDFFEARCADEGGRACGFFEGQTFDREAVARLGQPDPRVQAVVALTPGGAYAFGEAGLSTVRSPMVMAGTLDDELPYTSEARPVYDALSSGALATLQDAGHWSFSDLCAFLPLADCAGTSAGFMDPARVADLTRSRVTAHLDVHLKGEEAAAEWLRGETDMTWEEK